MRKTIHQIRKARKVQANAWLWFVCLVAGLVFVLITNGPAVIAFPMLFGIVFCMGLAYAKEIEIQALQKNKLR